MYDVKDYYVSKRKLVLVHIFILKTPTSFFKYIYMHKHPPLEETHLDAVRGLIELRGFHSSASKSRARRSDAAASDKDKQICFVLMPRT